MCLEKVINDNLQALVGLIFLYISREVHESDLKMVSFFSLLAVLQEI